MRRKHYSIHTERTYCDWIRRFLFFKEMKEREELFVESEQKIEMFLTQLALEGKVAQATQNQAINALVFLYKKVLQQELTGAIDVVRAPRKKHILYVLED